jgi:hypothetical protein
MKAPVRSNPTRPFRAKIIEFPRVQWQVIATFLHFAVVLISPDAYGTLLPRGCLACYVGRPSYSAPPSVA